FFPFASSCLCVFAFNGYRYAPTPSRDAPPGNGGARLAGDGGAAGVDAARVGAARGRDPGAALRVAAGVALGAVGDRLAGGKPGALRLEQPRNHAPFPGGHGTARRRGGLRAGAPAGRRFGPAAPLPAGAGRARAGGGGTAFLAAADAPAAGHLVGA